MIRRHKDASRAACSHIAVPCPKDLAYMPYQLAGIEYASIRSRVLIADEPGLGKTIEAIGVANYRDHRRILVIPPASVKINWKREFDKWSTFGLKSVYISGRKSDEDPNLANVVIINYDILKDYYEALRTTTWDLLIIDEAHYLKSTKADRTGQVFGRWKVKEGQKRLTPIPFKNILMLTGTPILSNPKELWPLVRVLDPEGLGSDWFAYARRYCQLFELERFDPAKGKMVHQGWKWDGAENLEELQEIMRSRFMIRRLKKDVMPELPPKTRQVIVLEAKKGLTKLLERETITYDEYVKNHGDEDIDPPAFTEMSKIQKEIAIAKIPYAIDYLKEMLNEFEGKKIVCFFHHHEVGEAIIGAFGNEATLIDGRVSNEDRQHRIDRFQSDPACRIFAASIKAAGVGITLTAAYVALFIERSWNAADVTQAEDRLHRKGQTENVLIRHLVLNGSQDHRQVQAIIRKQEIAEKTLDKEKKNANEKI